MLNPFSVLGLTDGSNWAPRLCGRTRVLRLLMLGAILVSIPLHARAWQAKRDTKRQIAQMEQQWRAAQLADDIPTMDRMLSEDYVGITMSGQVTTKVQQLSRLRNHLLVVTRLDLHDIKVKLLDQVAVVTVRAKVEGTSSAERLDGEYRYTRIYHQLPSGTWKITNFEATRVAGGRATRSAAAFTGHAG